MALKEGQLQLLIALRRAQGTEGNNAVQAVAAERALQQTWPQPQLQGGAKSTSWVHNNLQKLVSSLHLTAVGKPPRYALTVRPLNACRETSTLTATTSRAGARRPCGGARRRRSRRCGRRGCGCWRSCAARAGHPPRAAACCDRRGSRCRGCCGRRCCTARGRGA